MKAWNFPVIGIGNVIHAIFVATIKAELEPTRQKPTPACLSLLTLLGILKGKWALKSLDSGPWVLVKSSQISKKRGRRPRKPSWGGDNATDDLTNGLASLRLVWCRML